MSSIVLTSDTLKATPGAGEVEYNGQFFGTDSTSSRAQFQRFFLETAKASTSGTSVDFTGIPSWAKKITLMFDGVSTSGSSGVMVQLGDSGGIETTGYSGQGDTLTSSATASNIFTSTANSTGFNLSSANFISASSSLRGLATITNITGNTWVFSSYNSVATGTSCAGTGSKTLSPGSLDRVRITINGTDSFDAGSINILIEG